MYYKVVRVENGKLLSSWEARQVVEYIPNKFVTPNEDCGPLCVFSDFRAAQRYKSQLEFRQDYYILYTLEIWKCEIKESMEGRVWIKSKFDGSYDFFYLYSMPDFTHLAEEVKLTTKLE